MPPGRHFVGSHPLAGSEKRGVVNASPDLLTGAACIVTPPEQSDPQALETVSAFWQALGMKVFTMTPEEHDAILAAVSHLPHLLAACLIDSIPEGALPFGASGLRDTTRIAGGDAGLWSEIVKANGERILEVLDGFEGSLADLKGHILKGDWDGLERYLREAAEKRQKRYGEMHGED
jgi:prephenate dehydrogenase